MKDKNIIDELKNNIYEFEGLLELLTQRREKRGELLELMAGKLNALNAAFGEMNDEACRAEECGEPEPIDSESADAAEDEESLYVYPSEENADDEDEMPVAEEKVKADDDAKEAPEQPKRKAPAFCLNDRFRFRRGVFGGNEHLFEEVCERVAAMESYEEAEEYFYGTLGLDPEDNDVEDFMVIIREYFAK